MIDNCAFPAPRCAGRYQMEMNMNQKEINQKRLDRINALARKSKAEGLTEAEKEEQKVLRQEYLAEFRKNLRGQLESITIVEADGTLTHLRDKRKTDR